MPVVKVEHVLECVSRYFSQNELLHLAAEISSYHRIQGTEDLEKAAKFIADVLSGEEMPVEVLEYSYSESHGSYQPVAGWWVRDSELWLVKPYRKPLHSFRDSRTAVVAHSPGGTVEETEVVFVGRGEDEEDYGNVDGKAVLAYGSPYTVYKVASKLGASAVLLYRRNAPDTAVPYLGLFLTPEEAAEARTLAFSVSLRTASLIKELIRKGRRPAVSGYVDAGYRQEARIPVVTTAIGTSSTELHIYAHICHPGATVNDNVSGTVTVIETALALWRAYRKKYLATPDKHTIRFLFFPEYSGSMAYLEERGANNVVFSVNLDMVGEKQEVTGSTLLFIRPPPSLYHKYEALFYTMLRRTLSRTTTFAGLLNTISYRFDTSPYQIGSDHDAYIHWGIPSIMINQWPDRYYHTDMDTIDKFDPYTAKLVGVAVGAAAYIASRREYSGYIDVIDVFYKQLYIGEELMRTPYEHVKERSQFLRDVLEGKMRGSIQQGTCRYVGPKGPISRRTLIRLLGKEYRKYRELVEEDKVMDYVVRGLIPLFGSRENFTVQSLAKRLLLELGLRVDEKKFEKSLDLLKAAKLVVCGDEPPELRK